MPTLKDLILSQFTDSVNDGAAFDFDLAEVGGVALAQLAMEYDTFLNNDAVVDGEGVFQASNQSLTVAQGGVVIEVVAANGDGAALLAELEALGLSYGGAYLNAVSGLFPIANLGQLPSLANVAFASASYIESRVGSVDNQADVAMNTDDLRTDFGVDGSGVTVGILSDSFDSSATATTDYADDIASGDLPAGINVLVDLPAGQGSDEGRAMAQLIHDIAPGATLEFASAFLGAPAFAQSILDLSVNADVIVDDVGYFSEPFFQDGVVAQAVDTVFAAGKAYFSSTGNSSRASYETDYVGVAGTVFGNAGTFHDFDPGAGVDLTQDVTLQDGETLQLALQWDDPFVSGAPGSGGAVSDLDILFFNGSTGTPLSGGVDDNIGADPLEIVSYTNETGSAQQIAIAIGTDGMSPAPNVIKYIEFGGGTLTESIEYATLSGTSFGHPSAEGGLGVGAAFYPETPEFGQTPPLLEFFSALGDTPIYFDAAGNRLATPEVRERVDITAPDGTDTTFFGTNRDATPAPNFTGTSAAAPHAAALAALMVDANGALTPTQIYDAMQTSAIDILETSNGDATGIGYDNWSGHGLIDGPAAFAAAGIMPGRDVAIDDFFVSQTMLFDSDVVDVGWTIRNVGVEALGLDFDNGLYLSNDMQVDVSDTFLSFATETGPFAPGDEVMQTLSSRLPVGLASGTYFLAGIADDTEEIGETNRTNNTSDAIAITVINTGAVELRDDSNNLLSMSSGIAGVIDAAASGDVISVDETLYTLSNEDIIVSDNITFDLGAGVTPTLTLDELGGLNTLNVTGAGAADINGNSNDNGLRGGGGDDTFLGGIGADTLDGGSGGSDWALYFDSTARVEVDLAADTVSGGTATGDELISIENIEGSDFNDKLVGDAFANTFMGLNGADNLSGGGGNDSIVGGADNDILSGGNNNDTINGGTEDDNLFGNGGNDSIIGGFGEDSAFGGVGADTIATGADNDSVLGQGGADEIFGGGGADILRGGSGNDYIEGGAENDSLFGQGNNDTILGGGGDDSIQGNAGVDHLIGNSGDDTLFSGAAGDRLDGGTGNDLMNGGTNDGALDTFVFLLGYDQDRINQFDQVGNDRLELDQDLWFATNPTLTEQQVVDTFGTLNANGTILTLDFGGGDVLEVQNSGGITQATLGADIVFV